MRPSCFLDITTLEGCYGFTAMEIKLERPGSPLICCRCEGRARWILQSMGRRTGESGTCWWSPPSCGGSLRGMHLVSSWWGAALPDCFHIFTFFVTFFFFFKKKRACFAFCLQSSCRMVRLLWDSFPLGFWRSPKAFVVLWRLKNWSGGWCPPASTGNCDSGGNLE